MDDLIFVVLALLAWSALSFWVGYMVGWGRCFKELEAEIERLELLCEDYAQMTGIILNVPIEQRQAFSKALDKV